MWLYSLDTCFEFPLNVLKCWLLVEQKNTLTKKLTQKGDGILMVCEDSERTDPMS